MLKRINGALFEEDAGPRIELAVKAQNNNGVESARFDYDSAVLPKATVQGHPGCRFSVLSGIRQFRALVVFDPGAPRSARYDLFQVNAAGTLAKVGKSVTNAAGTPLIGFGIDGVTVMAPARRRPRRAKAAKKAKVRKTAKRSRKSSRKRR